MPTRRSVILGASAAAALTLGGRAAAASYRAIPQRPSARVIVDNDFAGDPDGLVALAHQLLTPKTRTVLVTSSALDPKLLGSAFPQGSAVAGRDAALELIARAGISPAPLVIAGSEALGSSPAEPSAAARAIVAEAMRDDPLPLFFTCGGPLTNLAAALRMEPAIARRMTVIWIGGGAYPKGGWEYNLATDLPAARSVIEQSRVPLWQVPQPAYRQMQASVAELADQLRPISPFAAWLYDKFTSPPAFVDLGGSWPMGDSPTVMITAITSESSTFADRAARRIKADGSYGAAIPGRTMRVYETLDARLTFADFLALMRLHAKGEI